MESLGDSQNQRNALCGLVMVHLKPNNLKAIVFTATPRLICSALSSATNPVGSAGLVQRSCRGFPALAMPSDPLADQFANPVAVRFGLHP